MREKNNNKRDLGRIILRGKADFPAHSGARQVSVKKESFTSRARDDLGEGA